MGSELSNPASWVDQYGDYLFQYAIVRVGDQSIAEDLVQETFLAALRSKESFASRSSEKTWLTSILKHKIMDYFRSKHREKADSIDPMDFSSIEHLFDENGQWNIRPKEWKDDPESSFEKKEFWKVFTHCLSEMSEKLRTVFVLRELDGLGTDEICNGLNITPTNCWVILYRARTFLRKCLEELWFAPERHKQK